MLITNFNKVIPTYDNGTWTETTFDNIEDYRSFLLSVFKEPGKYNLGKSSELFNEQARLFRKQGDVYCMAPFRSKDFVTYWDGEKQKSTEGCIFLHDGNSWYLPRDYYFWINFLPIYDKIKKDYYIFL